MTFRLFCIGKAAKETLERRMTCNQNKFGFLRKMISSVLKAAIYAMFQAGKTVQDLHKEYSDVAGVRTIYRILFLDEKKTLFRLGWDSEAREERNKGQTAAGATTEDS